MAMKKLLSFILALCMVLSTAATLSFAGYATEASDTTKRGIDDLNVTFAQELDASNTDSNVVLNIDTVADWEKFVEVAAKSNLGGRTIHLNIDIVLNDAASFNALTATAATNEWTSIPNFKAKLDGGNHTISGMYTTGAGFIDVLVPGAEISNLVFENCCVLNADTTSAYNTNTGLVAGDAGPSTSTASGNIALTNVVTSNCRVEAKTRGVGGLIGGCGTKATVTLTSCQSGTTVTHKNTSSANWGQTGGLIGATFGQVNLYSCVNAGKVSAENSGDVQKQPVGGLIGFCEGKLYAENCRNTGSVSAYGIAGGILGRDNGTATRELNGCVNEGSVTDSGYAAGGIVGRMYGGVAVKNCTNDTNATVSSAKRFAGGIVGLIGVNGVSVENCTNKGTVSVLTGANAGSGVGGIVGGSWNTFTVNGCRNEGAINNPNTYSGSATPSTNENTSAVGGIVGHTSGQCVISDSVNNGAVTGKGIVGGVIGYSGVALTVENSANTAAVLANKGSWSDLAGGVIGRVDGAATVRRAANIGNVSAYNNVGGLIGAANAAVTMNDCVNVGTVNLGYASTGGTSGGLIGRLSASSSLLENCLSAGTLQCKNLGVYTATLIGDASSAIADGSTDCITLKNTFTAKDLGEYQDNMIGVNGWDTAGEALCNLKLIYGESEAKEVLSKNIAGTYGSANTNFNAALLAAAPQMMQLKTLLQDTMASVDFLMDYNFNFAGTWYISYGTPVPVKAVIESGVLNENLNVVYEGYQDNVTTTDFDVRVVAGVNLEEDDLALYDAVGFKLQIINSDVYEAEVSSDTVYKEIQQNENGNITPITAAECGRNYLTAVTVSDLTGAGQNFSLIVTPFAQIAEGKITGTTVVLLVENGEVVAQYAI